VKKKERVLIPIGSDLEKLATIFTNSGQQFSIVFLNENFQLIPELESENKFVMSFGENGNFECYERNNQRK